MRCMRWTIGFVCLAGLVGCMEFDPVPTDAEIAVTPDGKAVLSGRALARVSGGGEAEFVAFPGSTIFGVGANVYADGSAVGSFMCMIPGVFVIQGQALTGTLNGDGSVTLQGVGAGYDLILGERFEDCAFEVTLRTGGPGVGGFTYSDCVVPPPGDTEIVIRGHILIH